MTGDRLDDPELGPAERAFLAEVADAFTGLEQSAASDLYVEGAARLLSAEHAPDLPRAGPRRGVRRGCTDCFAAS